MSELEGPARGERDWMAVALARVGDAVIATDALGHVVFMNPAAELLTGWRRDEAAGLPARAVFRVVGERDRRPVPDPFVEVSAAGPLVGLTDHKLLVARDGTERPLESSAVPIRDAGGAAAGAVLIFRDAGERHRAERAAEEARAYAEAIVETIREALVVLDADLRVRTANRAFYRAFGGEPSGTEGRPFFELCGRAWDVPRLRELLGKVLPEGSPFDAFEVEAEFAGLGRRVMLLNARRLGRDDGPAGLILLAIADVTESRRSAGALAASETRYRRLFEAAQDGILILDPDTRRIVDANPFLTAILGYSRQELVGKELWEIGFFRDAEDSRAAFRTLQEEGYIRYEDLPLRTKDGRRIEVEFVSNVYREDGTPVVQCNVRDVTDRKRAEEALRAAHDELEARVRERTAELTRANEALTAEIGRRELAEAERRRLLRRLASAQEDERRRIARELHDQTGQHVAALGLGLKVLGDAAPEGSPARAGLHQLQELTDRIGREVHHLALELRPTALDDFGLRAALQNYAEGWSERCGVEVDFHSSGLDDAPLPPLVETAVYRVVQEALANVRKHARARRVSVVLRRSAGQAQAVVEDDGCGFDGDEGAAPEGAPGRLGLLGMRERSELVGGTLTVESSPGRGTTVIVRVPLPGGAGEGGDG